MSISNFNAEQSEAYRVFKYGCNMFISGGAGVGKTFLLNELINESIRMGKNTIVTAPTGIASLNINGATMHHAFEIPFGVLTYRKSTYVVDDKIIAADVIFMEEISMCRIDTFDFIANKILEANRIRKTQGKPTIQLVVVGDFLQLPPVMKRKEKELLDKYYGFDIGLGFAYKSKFWDYFQFYNVILTQVMRQADTKLAGYLNKLRTGNKEIFVELSKRASTCKNDGIELCGLSSEVTEINNEKLNALPGQSIVYTAAIAGDVHENDTIADISLTLKVGARIIMLVNNKDNNTVNGQFGTVTGLYSDAITVRIDGNTTDIIVTPFTWDILDYKLTEDTTTGEEKLEKYVCGTITQFPVKLAYAMTIHKSQGQTFDKANISPYCWECGQLYVAISRVRSIEGIHFNYIPEFRYAVTALSVIEFYNKIVDKINKGQEIKTKEEHQAKGRLNDNIQDLASIIGMLK